MDPSALIRKLRLHTVVKAVVLNAPEEFLSLTTAFEGDIESELTAPSGFIIVFVKDSREVSLLLPAVRDMVEGDGILWTCYPKKTSKKYHSDINRDKGWDILTDAGFTGISMVSINDDWSALRFRKKEFSSRKQ